MAVTVIARAKVLGRRGLVRWVELVRRHAPAVLATTLLASAAALYYSLTHFSINTSTTDMLSAELPFRQNLIAVDRAFPQLGDNLIVVVDRITGPENPAVGVEDLCLALVHGLPEVGLSLIARATEIKLLATQPRRVFE